VKSTQIAGPALVSLVPVDIDLCRKRESDLTHNHFPQKTVHCEGLSVYHHWCGADSDIVRGSVHPEPDSSLMTHSPLTRTNDPSSPVAQSVIGFIDWHVLRKYKNDQVKQTIYYPVECIIPKTSDDL